MAPPGADDLDADVRDLVQQARRLLDRLLRLTTALALSEDVIADALAQGADSGSAPPARSQRQAERARTIAKECRAFAARLDST